MENNLSSTAVVKQDHEAAKTAQYDLPSSYGRTESFLLPKDPSFMFLFWDIINDTFDFIKNEYGFDIFDKSKSVIRVYDITDVDNFNGVNALSHFDVHVILGAYSWYINIPSGGRKYVCDIGLITPQGKFILITRSNSVLIPSGKVSNVIDEKWMLVEGDYQKLVRMSGAEAFGLGAAGSSERVHQILAQRWKMFEFDINNLPSSLVSSRMSSGAFGQPLPESPAEDDDIWLKADCELIVYGQASKNAKVFLGDKPLQLNADGTFSLRYSLQDGQVIIPVRAVHHSKEEKKRAITIKAQREKES